MKLKYYLRGVGAGILFATIILSVSFRVSSKTQLSDDDIMIRAEELGMVKQSDINIDDLIAPSITPTAVPSINPTTSPTAGPTGTPTAVPAQKPTGTPTAVPTQKPTGTPIAGTTAEPTPAPAKAVEESDNAPVSAPEVNSESDNKSVSFEIVTGMTSEDVSKLLKEKGVIEDAKAFNQYLKQNDFTTDINIGKYEIEKYASYEEIADIIVLK